MSRGLSDISSAPKRKLSRHTKKLATSQRLSEAFRAHEEIKSNCGPATPILPSHAINSLQPNGNSKELSSNARQSATLWLFMY